jgi:activator of Hsp90 ATPase-like protein
MTWADDAWPADTRVGFRLSEYGDKTRLVLDHSGWSVHPAGEREALIAAHARGWSRYLARLAEYAAEVGPSERERRQHHSPELVGGQGFAHDEGA